MPVRGATTRGVETVLPPVSGASLLGPARDDARRVRSGDLQYARTGPIPVGTTTRTAPPSSLGRKRDAAFAAAAIAVVGAMSGAAALLPTAGADAQAGRAIQPVTSSQPTWSSSRTSAATALAGPATSSATEQRQRVVRQRTSATPDASTTGPKATRSPRPSATTTSPATGSPPQRATSPRSSGAGVVAGLAALGPLSGGLADLLQGVYSMRDFAVQSSGALVSGSVLQGAGVGRTVIRMAEHTSTRASSVPDNGNNQGGLANPTNPLYLLRGVNRLENATIQGTEQGHLYNGVYMAGSNIVIRHVQVNAIPGNSNANPGETFAVNVNRASGTNTVEDLTINGGSGALTSAAGLAINNSDADWRISDLTTRNLRYSAGIALWQVRGTFDIRDYVQRGGARSLGAERMAGTVNLYDPKWDAGTTGHDITYTWDGGYSGGSINVRYSSRAEVPDRKIQILTNKAAGIAGSVHVYIGGVEQDASRYVTVN
ncbi:hypothetical protein [Amnibacterium kyonggiense]|uniref:Uncharacterized protein n=1 Tax=Amnibacterium kyonggiense TaxID=595671 RepID=A0A4R7FDB2_9MICO|nr:hypothetical protein [Amnibacterium kyonggiense]TDS74935.1 hypothetical protein CLV52_3459 [Amnibacterium kyonggiense]